MTRRRFVWCAPALCAVALSLPGCGGSSEPGATAAGTARSWMADDAKSKDLLYISDLGTNAVDVYSYPKGAEVGKLTGFGSVAGLCTDKAGDVFVVDEAGPVAVYSHGGSSPMRKLQTSGAPDGCSVDPTTGNLAVTNESSYLYGTIAIYAHAKGKAKPLYNDMVDATFYCGYDPSGDLFIDGWDRSAKPIFLELPHHGKTIKVMTLSKPIETPGGVQWDGKYVAVGDKGAGVVYRASPSGKVEETIKLKDGTNVLQFWIQGSTIVGPNAAADGTVPFWHYPGGGTPYQTLTGFTYPIGATLSTAK
ncbi:MAG TPA: hypothetical protein VMU38_02715 [Candidatus Binatia bacterium]|nr:hypothetical protein [Candidatus Binatia bacterium]